MKKILIFSTAYFPHVGGAEVAVKEITRRIPDFQWEMITVRLSRKDAKQEKVDNIKVYRVGRGIGKLDKLLFPRRAARLADQLHKENHYDAVWSIMASFSGFAALFFKKKNPDIKFLLTLQEGDDLAEVEHKVRFVRKWFREIFTKADYIQAISNYLADWAKKMGAKCPVEVVPNGIQNSEILKLKNGLGIKEDERVILTTSRLVKKNGIEYLIKAICKLQSVNCKLIICGTGELENELRKLTKGLQIEDKVKFIGFVPPEELPKYYAVADVFCRPSLTEGLGVSFLEAMGAGVPVIATPVGGIPDFLEEGKTGWFCKVKNPQSIADKVKYILDKKNKEKVEEVVKNAKEMVKQKYNWDIIAKQIEEIISEKIWKY